MHSVEPTRLSSLLINEAQIKAAPGGLELRADGVLKSQDLLGPPGTFWFSWERFPADIVEKARELLHVMEEYVSSMVGDRSRPPEKKPEDAKEESLLPEEGFEEESDLPDLASFVEDLKQF